MVGAKAARLMESNDLNKIINIIEYARKTGTEEKN